MITYIHTFKIAVQVYAIWQYHIMVLKRMECVIKQYETNFGYLKVSLHALMAFELYQ